MGARYYNPRTSVWLSVDPLAEEYTGRCSYEYALSNPVRYTDPTGMGSEESGSSSKVQMPTLQKATYGNNAALAPVTFVNNACVSVVNQAVLVANAWIEFTSIITN